MCANFTNHPKRLRSGDVSEDCYFYAIGKVLGVPPHKAPIKELIPYAEFLRSTNISRGA